MLLNNKHYKAFSLVEISMVLVIIGVLASFVLSFINSNNDSGNLSIIDNISKITQAVDAFEKTYGQLPGDMYNPQTIFTVNAVNGDPNTTKGNGDGNVTGNEGIYAFQHLVFAGFLQGNYNGTWAYSNMYHGPSTNSVFYFVSGYNDPIVLRFSKVSYVNTTDILAGANLTYSALSVRDMSALDNKYDDGSPTTGNIRAYDGSDVAANSCVTAGGQYNLANINNPTPMCYFDIRFKRTTYSNP